MPSVSESQRRLFGMVLAAKRGKKMPARIQKISKGISESDAKDFASKVKKGRQNVAKSVTGEYE